LSEFERPRPNYRLVQTNWGDDLSSVANRELGDANRWPELIWLNELVPPYITNEASAVINGVILAGELIKVPSALGVYAESDTNGQVYERDCFLVNKLLQVDEFGDFAIVSGVDNLKQQLTHAINTPRGQLRRHPDYGCLIWRLQGTVNGPTAGILGAKYVKSTLLADYRISSVESASSDVDGDRVNITATAKAIEGSYIDIVIDANLSVVTIPVASGFGSNYGNNWGN
jgi:phage baseplate assembly protein W